MKPSKVYLTTAANGPILGLQPRELRRSDPPKRGNNPDVQCAPIRRRSYHLSTPLWGLGS